MSTLRIAICLATFAAGAVFVQADPVTPPGHYEIDPAATQHYGPAYRYPQAGWIVLHIEGEPYERGYQHGRLLAAEIADHVQALATYRSSKAPTDAWRDLRMMCNALFLRRYEREFLEEMKGIADGAAAAGATFDGRALDLLDVVTVNSGIEIDFLESGLKATPTGLEGMRFKAPTYSDAKKKKPAHCSAFAATAPATADGKILFGHITMWNLFHVHHFNVWLDIKPKKGHRISMQTFPGGIMSGMDYYQNDAGLLVAETTIHQTHFDPTGESLCSRIRKALQYSSTIDDAVKTLRQANNGLYTNEWMLADIKTNEIAMLELGTKQSRLWRSSKGEWPGGTAGFYWGCNNAKDLAVRMETIPSLRDRPANLAFCPSDRDCRWLEIFGRRRGKLTAAFGFEAFTTPPIAAYPSCDAKFTTTDLAKQMKSYAIFGPPLGRSWEPTAEERKKHPDLQPLVSNDWTLLAPPDHRLEGSEVAVDLAPSWDRHEPSESPDKDQLPIAWHGTLLPRSDADVWLSAAFAEYERIAALDNHLRKERGKGELTAEDQAHLDNALFSYRSRYLTAVIRHGKDIPLSQVRSEDSKSEWYEIAVGKGVLLLHELRRTLGAKEFDAAMDAFGTANAGKEVTTAQFRAAVERASQQHPLDAFFDEWLKGNGPPRELLGAAWSVESYETEPDRTLIIYGTKQERHANREAAELLQRKITRRWGNFTLPVKADTEVTAEELKSHHLLLIGRPDANAVARTNAGQWPVTFGRGSFRLKNETYAHPFSSVIVAGTNVANPRYSAVLFAGLSATGTRRCIDHLAEDGDDDEPAEVMLSVAGGSLRRMTLPVQGGLPAIGGGE